MRGKVSEARRTGLLVLRRMAEEGLRALTRAANAPVGAPKPDPKIELRRPGPKVVHSFESRFELNRTLRKHLPQQAFRSFKRTTHPGCATRRPVDFWGVYPLEARAIAQFDGKSEIPSLCALCFGLQVEVARPCDRDLQLQVEVASFASAVCAPQVEIASLASAVFAVHVELTNHGLLDLAIAARRALFSRPAPSFAAALYRRCSARSLTTAVSGKRRAARILTASRHTRPRPPRART